ncbi:hypothetical protein HZH68_004573 [Vespula germanica]|uniref:Uncharacterized protein n=1 Tax=Vespula germanica TaxID=30212 RepID=A0A834NI34_VESGE|nr:hypothetical protein HZH68_004573 [Vespula germanica]
MRGWEEGGGEEIRSGDVSSKEKRRVKVFPHLNLSYLILSHLISSHLISSYLISSHFISSRLVSSRLVSSSK